MLSDSARVALSDILFNIDLAESFVVGFDYEAFARDMRTFYATTRALEIISEASRRVPDDLKARHSAIAWQRMAGAGNVYRHDYEDVAQHAVWDAVHIALPLLRLSFRENTEQFLRYVPGMNRQEIIARLRDHEPDLKAHGIVHAALFGSRARRGNCEQRHRHHDRHRSERACWLMGICGTQAVCGESF